LQPLLLPFKVKKNGGIFGNYNYCFKSCFKGEEEKQKQGLEDVGNNNCDKNEEPKLVGGLIFKELLSRVKTW
jgi:hypothetical protein